MITKQVIQTCIDEMKELTKVDFCVIDIQGFLMASTFAGENPDISMMKSFFESPADSQIIGGNYLFKVKEDDEAVFVLVASGGQADGYTMGKIATNQLEQLLVAYKEQFDHTNFIQNLLLDNLLLVDIYNRAKKLGISATADRIVFTVEVSGGKEREAMTVLKTAFAGRMDDFIVAVDEDRVILIHTLEDSESEEDMKEIAGVILDVMNTEAMLKVRVAYGTVVKELKDISKSYKEAMMALAVGNIFYADKTIIDYSTLGIGRLIYQLPVNLCRLYIEEVFGGELPAEINEEILHTVNTFLDNNLNVSETSRQLYIHRNTLVYRIEKLKAATDLDVRIFDDALTFKIAQMVLSYTKYMEQMEN